MSGNNDAEHRKLMEGMKKMDAEAPHKLLPPAKPSVKEHPIANEEYRRLLQQFIESDNTSGKLAAHRR